MDYQDLILDKEAGIATITLNRPERLNALSAQMEQSIGKALGEVEKDDSLKVLIVTGAGRGFCAGMDVNRFIEEGETTQKELIASMRSISVPLYNLSKPTIAAVNGPAVGAGFSIALLCDMRIASETAAFASAFVRRGLIPDTGASYFLPRMVGTAKAMELMVTGDPIDAAEAQRLGLVNKVVPEADLMKVTRELADRIAKAPPIAIGLTKQAVRRGIYSNLEEQIEWECLAQHICLRTEDHKEGVRAFLEKRPPEFKGR